jgi:alkylation response protein AidB-like acyl-CoA dehydrogenase
VDFELTAEQREARDLAHGFAEDVLIPQAEEFDRRGEIAPEVLRKMGSLGLLGVPVPRSWGGAERDTVSYALGVEEIARGCVSTSVTLAVHLSVCTLPILLNGTQEQKERFLPRLAKGDWIGGFALTEPGSGSDAAALKTSYRKEGDLFILDGTKLFVTNGARGDVVLAFATRDPAQRSKGITAFLLQKGMKGYVVRGLEKKMGLRASDTAEIGLEGCAVPKENVLGAEGEGFKVAMSTLETGRVCIAAQGTGIARAAHDETLAHLKQRYRAEGSVDGFQAESNQLADMAMGIEASRLLYLRAASLKDRGLKPTVESSMAKTFATEHGIESSRRAVQIVGPEALRSGHRLERLYRDAKVTEIYEGTSEIQRLVIANNLLKGAQGAR